MINDNKHPIIKTVKSMLLFLKTSILNKVEIKGILNKLFSFKIIVKRGKTKPIEKKF